jgi:ribosomal-protein-alanine N-acetyltransferase
MHNRNLNPLSGYPTGHAHLGIAKHIRPRNALTGRQHGSQMQPHAHLKTIITFSMTAARNNVPSRADQIDPVALLRRLADARRVHNRMDWWTVDEWLPSDAWVWRRDGAMLIYPHAHTPQDVWRSGPTRTAWLRWCGVSDGASASPVLRDLFGRALRRCAAIGVSSVWAIVEPGDWLTSYLANAGFARVDRMLTYQTDLNRVADWRAADRTHESPVHIRQAWPEDLDAVIALDERTFEEPWRYGPVIRRVYAQSNIFDVAVVENTGAIVGYASALQDAAHVHVVRLAVDASHRRRGIATQLLANIVRTGMRAGAARLSLNTQHTNTESQRLYERLGFHKRLEQPHVMRCDLPQHVEAT